LVIGGVLTAARPEGRAALNRAARGAPLIGGVLRAREISLWARLIGLALGNGVALLPAAALARAGAPAGVVGVVALALVMALASVYETVY
jgi:general secretion pathway protein F